MAAKMPLVAPMYLPGQEPLPEGMTEADREQIKEMTKYQNYTQLAMESCLTKSVMSGVLGFGLGAFFALMSASFALDDPIRQTMAIENAKRLEADSAKKQPTSAKPSSKPNTATSTTQVKPAPAGPVSSALASTANSSGVQASGSGSSSILSKLPGKATVKDLPPPPPPLPDMTTMQSTKQYFVQTGKSMYSSGKGFGKVGALYSGIECVIEGYRAKNDIWNPVLSGFVAGGVLARHSGPQAVVGGGIAFAAFSGAIDLLYVE
ncbi:Mitochondrial import inner membrane translocase subunit tim22 [Malassezia psittaci]|uniref:Mitochondrial import inner membrane translocase subunit TIM22 n=1 Tax=Malassezia psittaci TaxID=1821823 RepID=A0AAF0FCW9_9BASI|nr:Mitochondrial import inner membrane translocase subunit tim22 [Malassezia psittaci]